MVNMKAEDIIWLANEANRVAETHRKSTLWDQLKAMRCQMINQCGNIENFVFCKNWALGLTTNYQWSDNDRRRRSSYLNLLKLSTRCWDLLETIGETYMAAKRQARMKMLNRELEEEQAAAGKPGARASAKGRKGGGGKCLGGLPPPPVSRKPPVYKPVDFACHFAAFAMANLDPDKVVNMPFHVGTGLSIR